MGTIEIMGEWALLISLETTTAGLILRNPVLKKAGIAEVFGPGTPLKKIVEYISAAATDLK